MIPQTEVSASLAPPDQARSPYLSWHYFLLVMGIVLGALIPLGHWGASGLLLSIWMAVVGGLLLHEFFYPGMVLAAFGVICAPAYEESLRELHSRSPNPLTEWLVGAVAILAILIAVLALLVWLQESTPLGLRRVLVDFVAEQLHQNGSRDGLTDYQFSLSHMLVCSTAVCLATVPVFYLGLSEGSLLSPVVVCTAALLWLKRYRLALLSCLAYPFIWQLLG